VVLQPLRRWEDSTSGEHAVDPVIDRSCQLRLVEALEPDRALVEYQERVVACRARPQAAGKRQMDPIAYPASLPLVTPECLGIDWQPALLVPPTATTAVLPSTHQQLALELDDVEPKVYVAGDAAATAAAVRLGPEMVILI
jgi:hypothetical protein